MSMDYVGKTVWDKKKKTKVLSVNKDKNKDNGNKLYLTLYGRQKD